MPEALEVDLPITGNADGGDLPVAAGLPDLDHDVLQRVGGGVLAVERAVGPLDQSVDGRGVTGLVSHRVGQTVEREVGRDRCDNRFDVGRVTGLRAADEGILADLALGQELLEALPPMAPEVALTMTYRTPRRSKIRW